MGVDEVFNYVMETPGNTNPNVLRSLLNNLNSGVNLPDNPTTDGTYNLQNSVSSGTSTLSWASGSPGGGVLVVHGTTTDGVMTLDKTWQEIVDAGFSAVSVYNSERDMTLIESFGGYMVDRENPDTPVYLVFYGNDLTFGAPSANDYPNDEGLR